MIKLVNEIQKLDDYQFKDRTDIYEVVISGVKVIPLGCFMDCVNLRRVTIRGGCSEVGTDAFYGCTALEELLVEDESHNSDDGASAVDSSPDVMRAHTTLDGAEISWNAFDGCVNLRRNDLLENAVQIERMAFKGCTSLLDIHLGSALEELAKSAFLGCDLSRLSIDNNQKYRLESGFLVEKKVPDGDSDKAECRAMYYIGSSPAPKLPRGTTDLSDLCFSGSSVDEITLPPALLTLDDIDAPGDEFTITEIMSDDTDGKLIALRGSGTGRCYDPFRDCSRLRRFRLQKGNPAFSVMKGVLFSKDKKTLFRVPPAWPGSTFGASHSDDNDGFVYVVPEGTRMIANNAFSRCTTITDVVLPSTLETIGFAAFSSSSIVRITVAPGNKTFHSEGELLYEINTFDRPEDPAKVLVFCNRDATNADVKISPDTIAVQSHAFEGCSRLSQVELPESITFIGESAFEGCCAIEEMYIPKMVTGIEPYTFGGCSSLHRLHLHDGTLSIGKGVLRNCCQELEIHLSSSAVYVSDYVYNGCECRITFSFDSNYDESGYEDIFCGNDVFFYEHIVGYKAYDESQGRFSSQSELAELTGTAGGRLVDSRFSGYQFDERGLAIAYYPDLGCHSLVQMPSEASEYSIPCECEHVAKWAFLCISQLEYLYFPDSVKYFDFWAIYCCHNLRVVRFPEHAFIVEYEYIDEEPFEIRPITLEEALRIAYRGNLTEVIIGQKRYSVKDN